MLQLIMGQGELATLDGGVVRTRQYLHLLEFADHVFRIVTRKGPRIQPIRAVAVYQPLSCGLIVPPVRCRRETDQKRFIGALPSSQPKFLHRGCEGRRYGAVGLVKDQEPEVSKKIVSVGPPLYPGSQRLYGRNNHVHFSGWQRGRLSSPHARDA